MKKDHFPVARIGQAVASVLIGRDIQPPCLHAFEQIKLFDGHNGILRAMLDQDRNFQFWENKRRGIKHFPYHMHADFIPVYHDEICRTVRFEEVFSVKMPLRVIRQIDQRPEEQKHHGVIACFFKRQTGAQSFADKDDVFISLLFGPVQNQIEIFPCAGKGEMFLPPAALPAAAKIKAQGGQAGRVEQKFQIAEEIVMGFLRPGK